MYQVLVALVIKWIKIVGTSLLYYVYNIASSPVYVVTGFTYASFMPDIYM